MSCLRCGVDLSTSDDFVHCVACTMQCTDLCMMCADAQLSDDAASLSWARTHELGHKLILVEHRALLSEARVRGRTIPFLWLLRMFDASLKRSMNDWGSLTAVAERAGMGTDDLRELAVLLMSEWKQNRRGLSPAMHPFLSATVETRLNHKLTTFDFRRALDRHSSERGLVVDSSLHVSNESQISRLKDHFVRGFYPYRGDFDMEFDDGAELSLADLAMYPDQDAQSATTCRNGLLVYNQRLAVRDRVKQFALYKGLYFPLLTSVSTRLTRPQQSEIVKALKPLVRHTTKIDRLAELCLFESRVRTLMRNSPLRVNLGPDSPESKRGSSKDVTETIEHLIRSALSNSSVRSACESEASEISGVESMKGNTNQKLRYTYSICRSAGMKALGTQNVDVNVKASALLPENKRVVVVRVSRR